MSGANALPQEQLSSDRHSHEPSMEEILASIRRIISDDQMLPLSPRADLPRLSGAEASARNRAGAQGDGDLRPGDVRPEQEAGAQADDDDVLDLADAARHDGAAQSAADRLHEADNPAVSDIQRETFHHHEAEGNQPNGREVEAAAPSSAPAEPSLQEPQSAAASGHAASEPIVSEHTGASVATHFQQLAATMLMQNFPPVDEIARELLRPMLKTWLDDNLPVMVERLVRAEIERVARGGR